MAWEPVGRGTGADSAFYYREAGEGGRWFASPTEIAPGALGNSEAPPGVAAHSDAPPPSAPLALRSSYMAAHPPPEPTGGGTRRRPVTSGEALHNGPSYPPDMTPAVNRLLAAGIDPDAYFTANPIPASGPNRAAYIEGIRTIPPGSEGDATLQDNYRISAAEYELNQLRQKGISTSDAYAYLRAQGLLSSGAVPPDSWNDMGNPPRLGSPPGDRASALHALPHTTSGTPPVERRTTPVSDVTAALVDFGDRPSPASDSLLGRLNASGSTAASRTETVRAATRRLEITNQWLDHATRPTNGTPPGLGYSMEDARGILRSMNMLDARGRPTEFDINTGAHNLFNLSEGTTVGTGSVFNPSGTITPRSPSLASDGAALRLDQPVPAHTGIPDPLTQGAIDYVNSRPHAPSASPVGEGGANPAAPGVAPNPAEGVPASSVPASGPAATGDALLELQDMITWYRDHGRPVPRGLAARANASGINMEGLTVSGTGSGSGSGAVGSGGVGGSSGSGSGSGGSVGGSGSPTGTSPFAPVPASSGPVTLPSTGALGEEVTRMRALGFNDAEIAEYQRQHPGREDAAISGSFRRPDGSAIPSSEANAVRDRTRRDLREGLLNETANGIYEASLAQNVQPPVSRENARLMAEQLYRERAGSGDGDPDLNRMLEVRGSVAEDTHWLAEPGHPDRINGSSGLLRRTAVHEENAFYTAARAARPGAFFGDSANGRTHLRGFLAHDGGRGAAILSDPAAIRAARTHPNPPLGTRLAAYQSMNGDERSAIEGAVRDANPPDTPDFSRLPAAERGRAEVQWQQTQIQHNWTEASATRERAWRVSDRAEDRAHVVEDRDFQAAEAYARDMRNERNQQRRDRQNFLNQMTQQFANSGMQLMQSQIQMMNQLTLQQLQAMNQLNAQLIAQGTPKPFDIVMGMLQGGRR